MPTYDSTFDPPAPLGTTHLRNPENKTSVRDVPMLIDSGADLTLIPRDAVDRLRVDLSEEIFELVGFDGALSLARAVQLDMTFLERTFRGYYLVLDRDYGILGRDILNHSKILLDGPGSTWESLGPPAGRR